MNSVRDHLTVGFPHSEIVGSKPARGSPTLIAACYVLHRLSVPRHPRNALMTLDRFLRRGKPNAKSTYSANVCHGYMTKSLAGPGHAPDQEKPIHDDKEPCVTSTQRLRQCRRQGKFHFPTNKQSKQRLALVEPVGIEPTTSSLQS